MPMFNDRDRKQLLRLLDRLARATADGTDMPPQIFDELLHVITLATVEVCILRRHRGRAEVWLTKRSPTESRYPNQWHMPGAFIRNGEQVQQVIRRIAAHELGGSSKISRPTFAFFLNLPHRHFGHCVSLAHACGLRAARPSMASGFLSSAYRKKIVGYYRQLIWRVAAGVNRA